MNLKELKSKVDEIFKHFKKSKNVEDVQVIIRTNDAEFGQPHVKLNNVSFGIDWDMGKVVLTAKDRIYKNPKAQLFDYFEHKSQVCFVDCGKDDCNCKVSNKGVKIYGVFVNNQLLFPVYYGEAYGKAGLQIVVEKYNEGVEYRNNQLNYDKYYDFQTKGNPNMFVGGLDNYDVIELKEIPCEQPPTQRIKF